MHDPARDLRPDAERTMWRHLRAWEPATRRFRRRAVIGPYVVDFACPAARLVVELEGVTDAEPPTGDRSRLLRLEREGFRTLRFRNRSVLLDTEAVLDVIRRELERG